MQYILLVIPVVLLAVDFSLNKIYQRLKGTSPVAGVIFFKERLSKNLIVSIVLCVAGTIMFL